MNLFYPPSLTVKIFVVSLQNCYTLSQKFLLLTLPIGHARLFIDIRLLALAQAIPARNLRPHNPRSRPWKPRSSKLKLEAQPQTPSQPPNTTTNQITPHHVPHHINPPLRPTENPL